MPALLLASWSVVFGAAGAQMTRAAFGVATVRLENGSERPVRNVRLTLLDPDAGPIVRAAPVLEPGDEVQVTTWRSSGLLVLSLAFERDGLPVRVTGHELSESIAADRVLEVAIGPTGVSAGLRWW